jgi:hypothetical protein
MFIRSVMALVGAQLIELRRSKTSLFWMMAFPLDSSCSSASSWHEATGR